MVCKVKIPKIPHGLTGFGVIATGTTAYLNHKKSQQLKEDNTRLQQELSNMTEENKGLREGLQEVKQQNEGILSIVKDTQKDVKDLSKKVDEIIDKGNNYLENNFLIPSLDDLKTLFNKYFEFLSSFDLHHQILVFNGLSSIFLLSLLFSYIIGLYGNYLIETFKLNTRFPKLSRLLHYRLQYQKFYFKYLFILALFTLLFNLFINLSILFT